jgi:hypothetical protein
VSPEFSLPTTVSIEKHTSRHLSLQPNCPFPHFPVESSRNGFLIATLLDRESHVFKKESLLMEGNEFWGVTCPYTIANATPFYTASMMGWGYVALYSRNQSSRRSCIRREPIRGSICTTKNGDEVFSKEEIQMGKISIVMNKRHA